MSNSKKIIIKSIWDISQYNPPENSILISILEEEDDFNTDFYNKYIKVLRLDIHDVDFIKYHTAKDIYSNTINEEIVQNILNFVGDIKKISQIVIHCSAGVSRSPAIAMGICNHFKLKEEFDSIIRNERYSPNLYILKVFGINEDIINSLHDDILNETVDVNKLYSINDLFK